MQYVRSSLGAVSKTWNSINPATLSGAIDVIVVEHEDGSLACSPFHVRFGKFSLLRPYEKKVEFKVNNVNQDHAMKLGEGGEAFFVFETLSDVPEALQTSPLVSPATSPAARPASPPPDASVPDMEPLDLDGAPRKIGIQKAASSGIDFPTLLPGGRSRAGSAAPLSQSFPDGASTAFPDEWVNKIRPVSQGGLHPSGQPPQRPPGPSTTGQRNHSLPDELPKVSGARSSPTSPKIDAITRAKQLSKKLMSSNIPSQVNDEGDLMLDMTGYKSSEEESLRAEVVARKILSEDLEGDTDIGSLIGADDKGNLWIYSSEEAKEEAARKAAAYPLITPTAIVSSDALSDHGYHSDEAQSYKSFDMKTLGGEESISPIGLTTPPDSPKQPTEPSRNYAKTLRLTSDQLKSLDLRPGPNPMSFTVNRVTCPAFMYLWKHDAPIVISDIDGTITKSDVLGHLYNYIGRDWTHPGVAKLYSDIVANGYNVLYLTSRSVGQADTTRTYINGIMQEGYKLPKGPVIMSPDRTIAALRREIYLRKPEVFKMACLRDIMSLFHTRKSPFYAGFGNRLTDALSYRSVNIPSTRIFTINSNAEVSLDLLSLNRYKTGYTSMREIVDHFFPPVGMLVQEGGEEYTDFNYWRDAPQELDDVSISSGGSDDDYVSDDDDDEDEDDDDDDGLAESYLSTGTESLEGFMRQSIDSDGRSLAEVMRDGGEIIVPVRSTDGSVSEGFEPGEREELRVRVRDLAVALDDERAP